MVTLCCYFLVNCSCSLSLLPHHLRLKWWFQLATSLNFISLQYRLLLRLRRSIHTVKNDCCQSRCLNQDQSLTTLPLQQHLIHHLLQGLRSPYRLSHKLNWCSILLKQLDFLCYLGCSRPQQSLFAYSSSTLASFSLMIRVVGNQL